ncbi:putative quinol monooxygenase [Robiginitomaculum antarcticum]|uniref:putative quinol monooxygenase n=1 Tax=Robiginitomaculum antarcticum TaxID=437507 RepID=UPI00036F0BF2|nr:putative quinol monooxygenase [Robiginitomaculum antarcticum]
MPLIVTAHIHAIPEQRDLVLAELKKLLSPTRAENGCESYVLHTNKTDPNHFVFIERWADKPSMDAHMKQPHMAACQKAISTAVKSVDIFELSPCD